MKRSNPSIVNNHVLRCGSDHVLLVALLSNASSGPQGECVLSAAISLHASREPLNYRIYNTW